MTMLERVGASGAVLRDARLLLGARTTIDASSEFVAGARSSITAELFKLNEPGFASALRERAAHVPVRLHADSQYADDPASYTIGAADGLSVTSHGAAPTKLHTKLVVVDGDRAYLGTAAPVSGLWNPDELDFAAFVGADVARPLEASMHAASSGDSAAIRATAGDLARQGVFLNDPAHGVTLLRERIDELIDGSQRSLFVGSKMLGDGASMDRLAAAQARGVRVLVETNPKAKQADVDAARSAGLDVTHMPSVERRLHGNVLVADGREAYFGTAMLSERGMARSTAGRAAREIGWVTNDRAGIDAALDAVGALEGSRLAEFRRSVDAR